MDVTSGSDDRRRARATAGSRQNRGFDLPRGADGRVRVSDIFGRLTFGMRTMRERMAEADCRKFERLLEEGEPLDRELAVAVARAARDWAIENGATHFTHWFQPLTGQTAEKHDAFLHVGSDGEAIERFDAEQLIQSEPDASSFPSGGMRATFEARGYTAWDPSSPMFLMRSRSGTTLCIPSAYLSYTGAVLDEKAGLLRSIDALSRELPPLLETLGVKDVARVTATLGPEQEYFLVDRAFTPLRPDLLLGGRTVLGAPPTKGQQLEDHYFGSIPPRVAAFMSEFEFELYELGVPVKTRHNEVAPGQFEMAPIFEEAQVAADHNQLAMEVMRRVARRHEFDVFFHEKPFAGVNGSGKHLNWSLAARHADGRWENLFEPGSTPAQNLQFLLMTAIVQRAILRHAGALRASISGAGNDHRLGANEAPPAIISTFLGRTLSGIFEQLASGSHLARDAEAELISLGIARLPQVKRDNTDRNRTSPFAFTGNKWEFRACGGSMAISFPITVLNAATAEAVRDTHAEIRAALDGGLGVDQAVLKVVRAIAVETAAVRFEGNNYAESWVVEAERRGLPNFRKTPDALAHLGQPKRHAFLLDMGVFSEDEIKARVHVRVERYVKDVDIECLTLLELLDTAVIPAVSAYHADLARDVIAAREAGLSAPQLERAEAVGQDLAHLMSARDALADVHGVVASVTDEADRARRLAYEVVPAMEAARAVADRLETLVADTYWPLPRYSEMLFVR